MRLEIITPEKVVLSQQADMVLLPAIEGQMGILPEHCPLIAVLEAGEVIVHSTGKEPYSVSIEGGIADITGTTCTVLAEVPPAA